MGSVLPFKISHLTVAASLVFVLGVPAVLAQPQTGDKDQSRIPIEQTAVAAVAQPDAPRDSVAKDAIRIPAMGVANAETDARAEVTPKPKRKKPRVVIRRMHEDIVYLPPPVYVPRPHYRFGYSYGPGIRLHRW